jgi:hypothetical protein
LRFDHPGCEETECRSGRNRENHAVHPVLLSPPL